MSLTSSIQSLLLDMQIPAGESMQDLVLDAQEYGIECLIEMGATDLSPEDIVALETMIENSTPPVEMDAWLSEKIAHYDKYSAQALEEVKYYLSEATEDEELDEPADEDEVAAAA